MQIPRYWAQTRLRHETGRRHGATVQRWGWSDQSAQAAQAHAQERAQAALDQVFNAPQRRNLDARFQRMERLGEYGLNDQTPIREEILAQRGQTVMTRNSYGAHCLNTPHVAIADMDFPPAPTPPSPALLLITAAMALAVCFVLFALGAALVAAVVLAGAALVLARWLKRWLAARQKLAGRADPRQAALERVTAFSQQHPDWGLRIYSTPKGLRIIVTHQTMLPSDSAVQALFSALQVDPIYQRLCLQQQCFRARVTGKPWRMDMSGPSPQVRRWPVAGNQLAARADWTHTYDKQAAQYSACQFIAQLGQTGMVAADIQALVDWHDEACRAHESQRPLA
ncbi:hypothetical protein M2375_003543 [Comamonas sp. BIGb0152]|uniref:hypothetical protein n=1 Tax=Comamonas sp. BIGb0152 TaxID=2940601 RepID=UPI00216A6741|nr:hypothetical protein [Comamonas sp. BIGb0152]MCS4295301.1 hypothetical protein [Comamonas sp. BIGb0152]